MQWLIRPVCKFLLNCAGKMEKVSLIRFFILWHFVKLATGKDIPIGLDAFKRVKVDSAQWEARHIYNNVG